MEEDLIAGLYVVDDSGEVVSHMKGHWFELVEDFDHKSVFESQLIPHGTRLMFMNYMMERYWFKFTIKMANLCGVSELGLRHHDLEKLEVKIVTDQLGYET